MIKMLQECSKRQIGYIQVLMLFCYIGQPLWASSPENLNFTFSADPGEAVLRVLYDKTMTGINFSFTLYGDGRLEYKSFDIHGNVYEEFNFSLEFSDMKALLNVVAEHNLVEASRGDIEKKVRALHQRGRLPRLVDAGDMTIETSLTSYKRNGHEQGPSANSVTLHAPAALSREYDLTELQGFAKINELMSRYRKLARESLGSSERD